MHLELATLRKLLLNAYSPRADYTDAHQVNDLIEMGPS